MITHDILKLMQCPHCQAHDLRLGAGRLPSVQCQSCQTTYPIVEGILDMTPPETTIAPGNYRTETLLNLVAGVYDPISPLMSVGVWNCSPLRFVDSENRALGRANHGVYLKAPIGTGMVLNQVLAPYHDSLIIGVDQSWKMLRRAARKLNGAKQRIQLMRVDYHALPFRPGCVDAIQSLNGIHTFPSRSRVLDEFKRCLKADGFLSGSALIRGNELLVDVFLDRFERYGVYPMLRTFEFYHKEFEDAQLHQLKYETHGAVLFYSGTYEVTQPLAKAQ